MEEYLEKEKVLEDLLMNIEVLEQVESKIAGFNSFEVLGIVDAEIRHSNVLAWLLNAKESHGLGDTFIRKFIQTVYYLNKNILKSSNINMFDLSLMDYYDFTVRREWRNIDILAVSEQDKFIFVIENKVWSKESSHQLKKYLQIVEKEFPNYNRICVFLTPSGDAPSDEDNWVIFDYRYVSDILKKSMELRQDFISTNVRYFLEQYMEILRRYIVGDLELEKMCRELYYKHQKAFDLIFEYKPDIYSDISYYINELLDKHANIIKDVSNKTYTRFSTDIIDKVIGMKGSGWTSTNRLLLYEIQNKNNKLVLKLIIGPGEDVMRGKIFDAASKNKVLFSGILNTLGAQYTQILSKDILPKNFLDENENDLGIIQKKINSAFERFATNELKQIDEYIQQNIK